MSKSLSLADFRLQGREVSLSRSLTPRPGCARSCWTACNRANRNGATARHSTRSSTSVPEIAFVPGMAGLSATEPLRRFELLRTFHSALACKNLATNNSESDTSRSLPIFALHRADKTHARKPCAHGIWSLLFKSQISTVLLCPNFQLILG